MEKITFNVSDELKESLDEYNYHNKKNKINVSDICRKALIVELERRTSQPGSEDITPENTQEPQDKPARKPREEAPRTGEGYQNVCENCGKEFKAKYKTTRFCGDTCQKAAKRKAAKEE